MTQIADDLRFTYCLDLFGQGHAWLVQSTLMFQNIVRGLIRFFNFRRKRDDDQGRCKSVAVVVLNDNNRTGASLNVTMMLAEVSKVNVTSAKTPIFVNHRFPLLLCNVGRKTSTHGEYVKIAENYVSRELVLDVPSGSQALSL